MAMSEESKDLLYEVREGAAWLTINRESKRNSISVEVIDLFDESLDEAEADDQVRVLCITGSGEKAFCSGADLGSTVGGQGADGPMRYARLLERMSTYPKPLVARLNGHCLAGGMGLMLSCDMVYAHEGVQVGTPEVKVGLFPMMISPLIVRNMPRKAAMEMMFTGERLSARRAEALGLITRSVATRELDDTVNAVLESICANAPLAIRMGRQAMAQVEDMELKEAIPYLHRRLLAVLNTEDAAEGLSAFFGKREPDFKGK